jgi:hypothetical protein
MAIFVMGILLFLASVGTAAPPVSDDTDNCISCHATATPGIVADWQNSRHANRTPAQALQEKSLQRRMSADSVPQVFLNNVVGCAECHTQHPDSHRDTFNHNGYQVHVVVTPNDCATCHPVERSQYAENLMSFARVNLMGNPVFTSLVQAVNGVQTFDGMKTTLSHADENTNAESCTYCHGTEVKVEGQQTRTTELGDMEFPVLSGWPNQGVGRLNPDSSLGSCAACHTRHRFSIEVARKPYTCSECHKGPDVPAYKVYEVSKHGNIFNSLNGQWNFENIPWTVGVDFNAPTCAACHMSLLTTKDGEVIAERTHKVNDRLPWRIFGLPYAGPHPKSPNTTIIKNKAGLPLPAELTGEPVMEYLIDRKMQDSCRQNMKNVCLSCHSESWVNQQYDRFENTIHTTNAMTLTATQILSTCWEKGYAQGLPQGADIFDEAIEKMWVEQWLFYANSTRFASAMAGADYGTFANGRWYMSKNIQDMLDWLKIRTVVGKQNK